MVACTTIQVKFKTDPNPTASQTENSKGTTKIYGAGSFELRAGEKVEEGCDINKITEVRRIWERSNGAKCDNINVDPNKWYVVSGICEGTTFYVDPCGIFFPVDYQFGQDDSLLASKESSNCKWGSFVTLNEQIQKVVSQNAPKLAIPRSSDHDKFHDTKNKCPIGYHNGKLVAMQLPNAPTEQWRKSTSNNLKQTNPTEGKNSPSLGNSRRLKNSQNKGKTNANEN